MTESVDAAGSCTGSGTSAGTGAAALDGVGADGPAAVDNDEDDACGTEALLARSPPPPPPILSFSLNPPELPPVPPDVALPDGPATAGD